MKMVSLFLLAVLATLASASPYFPDRDRGYGYMAMDYPSTSKDLVKNEEFPSAQSYEATTQGTERQEILAQSICTSIAGPNQWVFAVQRDCRTQDSCEAICTSAKLRVQAPQQRIKEREWRATLALHIYPNRPKSQPGNAHNPHLGFWVYRYANVNAPTGYCGPNYCCCSVAFSGPV